MSFFTLFSAVPKPDPLVVDRVSRNIAARLLRQFAGGQISNDAFEDQMPVTADPAIGAIWDTAWFYYSDLREHKLKGRDRLHPDAKRAWIRWLLFLDSDLQYLWPEIAHPGNDPAAAPQSDLVSWLRGLLPGEVNPTASEDFAKAGHYPVWPFISQSDYRNAVRQPRRLAAKGPV